MAYLLGVDGGTESIRAIVFDLDGRPQGLTCQRLSDPVPEPGLGRAESGRLVALRWARRRAARCAAAGIAPNQVIAMAVDTTCCSVVALDAEGKPLRPAMIWMDVRSAAEADGRGGERRSGLAHQRQRRGAGLRRMDDPEIALDETPSAGAVRRGGAHLRIPGLHQLAPHRSLGRLAQQHGRALALPEPRGRIAALLAREAGTRGSRGEVADSDRAAW